MKAAQVYERLRRQALNGEPAVAHLQAGLVVRVKRSGNHLVVRISRQNGRACPSETEVMQWMNTTRAIVAQAPTWDGVECYVEMEAY